MATKRQIEAGKANLDAGRNTFTSETAKEAQKESVKKRKANKTARELLAEALAKDNRKGKGMEKLAENYASGDINAIKLGQSILGEDNGPSNGTTINLIVSGDGETASLDRWAKTKE